MKAVWKFHLPTEDRVVARMPEGAQILSAQIQHGELYVWAVCDSDAPRLQRSFRIIGTGHEIDFDLDRARYINTFQLHDGALVFHIYEVFE